MVGKGRAILVGLNAARLPGKGKSGIESRGARSRLFGQSAIETAEIESVGERPADCIESIGDAFKHCLTQEIVAGEPRRGAIAPLATQSAIEKV
jgi:hypothetical protein